MSTMEEQATWKLRSNEEFVQFFRSKLAPCLAACEQDRQRSARNTIITRRVA